MKRMDIVTSRAPGSAPDWVGGGPAQRSVVGWRCI